ncbi:MAG: L-glutamate gamma-semialdehyde dehydrogenase [Candidatus Izimaplasma sp.]|nr:L-glutamate gamma-semialdehyde dehydrogenase [Candidatus Izimaplasma bacterium]
MAIYEYRYTEFTDFTKKENCEKYQEALDQVSKDIGKKYPLIINGEKIFTDSLNNSLNPANHKEVVGIISQASEKEAELAMGSALNAFESWKKTDPRVRADVLFKSAKIMRKRRFELSALMTIEAGKPWPEADADTAEAIDFLEYYGRQMLKLTNADEQVLSRDRFERNEFQYIPLGVGAVITPWNFPLAILTGMTSSAIVSGNTVLLKPAETTQVIAYKLMEILEEAGMPAGVVNFIPGDGPAIGQYMVSHPKTRFVSFTGSKAVGITINEEAAKVRKGQKWLKRVVAEMGGKDAIVVDKDADLELASTEIVKSAFGFAGQKCSACSRVIAHKDIYDELLDLATKKTKQLEVGNPENQSAFVGPVTNQKAFDKISMYLEIGKKEGNITIGGTGSDKYGYFIEPTIIADCDPDARVMQEEIFGPVVSFTKVKDFDEAITVANNTDYGLTGAVFSQNRDHLEKARNDFFVGNLYFNRKCTGAIVGYQPFGGFNMSGTDSKAGGPDYLTLFMQGKSITEQY